MCTINYSDNWWGKYKHTLKVPVQCLKSHIINLLSVVVILLCNAIRVAVHGTTALDYYITFWQWPIWRLVSVTFNVNARPWWPLFCAAGNCRHYSSLTHDDKSINGRQKRASNHLATHQSECPSTVDTLFIWTLLALALALFFVFVLSVSVCHLHMVTLVWATVTTKLISNINEHCWHIEKLQ